MFYIDSHYHIYDNYFSGIAFSYKDIILSLSGLEKYCAEHKNVQDLTNGRYSLVYSDELLHKTFIMTDPTGQDTVFYYKKNDFWAISNSLYRLIEGIRAHGIVLSVYEPSLYSYKIKHSLGHQPLSNNTIVKDVKILPRDKYIEVFSSSFYIKNREHIPLVITNDSDYISHLSHILSEQGAVLRCILESLDPGTVRCDLTGGFDSRFIFSLARSAGILKKLKISSNPKKEKDFVLAKYIANMHNLTIDNSSLTHQSLLLDSSKIFDLYKYGNSGVYNGGVYKASYDSVPATLHLHGAGGEALRGQYVGSPRQVIGRLEGHFDKNTTEFLDVKYEFLNYFKTQDIDIDAPYSMLLHARNFMSRFHFGRNWYRNLTNPLFSPMCDTRLEVLSDYLIRKYDTPRSIFYDTYLFLDKKTAFIPFDLDTKDIKFGDLDAFMKRSETMNLELYTDTLNYKIYGRLGEGGSIALPNEDHTNTSLIHNDSFDALANKEKELFLSTSDIKYHQFSNNIAVYTLLNLLI